MPGFKHRFLQLHLFLFYCLASLAPSQALGRNLCAYTNEIWESVANPEIAAIPGDIAIELETSMTRSVMDLVTTNTGKLDALFIQTYPEEFKSWANTEGVAEGSYDTIEWDRVPYQQKLSLIRASGLQNNASFFTDRNVLGLKYRDQIKITIKEPMEFFGHRFDKPGTYDLPLNFLAGKPEYKNSAAIEEPKKGFELHVRTKMAAGEASVAARRFQEALGVTPTSQHVHLVVPAPEQWLAGDRVVRGAIFTKFFSRVNRMAEMVAMISGSAGIKTKSIGNATYFDYLASSQLSKVFDAVTDTSTRKKRLWIPYVGFRPRGNYSDPNLFGLEFRAASKRLPDALLERMLNGVHKQLAETNFGISDAGMRTWISERNANPKSYESVADLLGRDGGEHGNSLSRDAAVLARIEKSETLGGLFMETIDQHHELDWLSYDWAKDIFLGQNAELVARIKKAQMNAIDALERGKKPTETMQEFVIQSGILEADFAAFGITNANLRQLLP